MANWPWLFAVNVPIGIAAFVVGIYALPHTMRATHRFDVIGAGLSALTFGFLIASIDSLGHGEMFAVFVGEAVATVVFGALFVRSQLSQTVPLLPLDLLRIPMFSLSVCTSICSFAAQMLAFVSLPFLLQMTLHFSAVETGLMITPWPLAIAVAAPVAGRLADRYPAGILGAIGLVVFAAGLFALAFMPAQPGVVDVAWRMALCGVGFGLFQSPNNRAMLSAAPRERSGGASGMLGTARLLGQTTGAALVALLFGRLPVHATIYALYIAGGIALLAACISALRLFDHPDGAPRAVAA